MKKFKYIIIIILCLFTITACEKEDNVMKSESEILKIVNNAETKDKIIKDKINVETFSDINLYGSTLEEVNEKYTIECLRNNNNYYYAIFSSKQEGWLYILFELKNNKYIVTDIFYYDKPLYKSDFEKLIIDVSQINDVRNIDKYGNEILFASSIEPTSFHNTLDGYKICIEYKDYPEKLVISSIEIEKSSNSVLDKLLDIDRIQ